MGLRQWWTDLRYRLQGDKLSPEDFALSLDEWRELEAKLLVEEPSASVTVLADRRAKGKGETEELQKAVV